MTPDRDSPDRDSPDRDSLDREKATAGSASDSIEERQIHGSLVEVRGLGVLILGPSGVGKSECVIELVRRGQRLVADDVVRLRTIPSGKPGGKSLVGWSPEHIRHYIEVRGLGLLCVADLFGREATLDECEVAFIVRLAEHAAGASFDRIGLERRCETLVGVEIPTVTLPVHAGSNLATLVDLAIRDWQLRLRGINAAERLDERLRTRGSALDERDGSDEAPKEGE